LGAIHELVTRKHEARTRIQEAAGVGAPAAKEIGTLLLFCGRTTPSYSVRLFQLLQQDEQRLERFLTTPYIAALMTDVREMWEMALARLTTEIKRGRKLPEAPPKALAKRRHWLYRLLERKLMTGVRAFLDASGTPYVLMHDGFMSKERMSLKDVERAAVETGFHVRFAEAPIRPDPTDSEEGDDWSLLDLAYDPDGTAHS
jgi:hypothetical protein